jgi:hypothetical protein
MVGSPSSAVLEKIIIRPCAYSSLCSVVIVFVFLPTVSSNQLVGGFPAEYGMLSHLEYFFASGNAFTEGIIPGFLGSLLNMREIGLKSSVSAPRPRSCRPSSFQKDMLIVDCKRYDLTH